MVMENGEYHYIGVYDDQILCGRSTWPHDGYCSPVNGHCPGSSPDENQRYCRYGETEANFNNWLAWLANIRYPSLTPAEEGTSFTSAPVVSEWNPCNCPDGHWNHVYMDNED